MGNGCWWDTVAVNPVKRRLEVFDPGFVRSRRGVRAACATVLAWATMLAVTAAFDVVDPFRITLFAAGAAFEGALLAPDPQPSDRVRTLAWAAVAATSALVVAVYLNQLSTWASALLLVLLIFLSYALRGWSTRVASLVLMAAITVYVAGAGHITVGRVGWFVVALVVGFAWIALWESIILPEDPIGSLRQSVVAFTARAAETVASSVDSFGTTRDGTRSSDPRAALNTSLKHVHSCRTAIESQIPGALLRGLDPADAEQLRVALYAADKGLQDLADAASTPHALPDEVAWSVTNTLHALGAALAGADSNVAAKAKVLRGYLNDEMPPDTLLATLKVLGAGELIAQSVLQATTLVSTPHASKPTTAGPAEVDKTPGLSPTMALAIQSVVAAVAAGLLAQAVGNDQKLVVAWTAFVVIAGSAGASRRRAWVRLPATVLGAIGGVVVAAAVPGTLFWTIAIVMVGVFFTIITAPVSYPAMVFWMSIAFVPIFATEGRYLDLIWDKSTAALIGGGVAAVVALTIVPIKSSLNIHPAVLKYLDALDAALASHLPGEHGDAVRAMADLDRAYAALDATASSAATETHIFNQVGDARDAEVAKVDAIHEAYLRLTPLLSDTSRALHGWTDDRLRSGIERLRGAVQAARTNERSELHIDWPATDHTSVQLVESRRRVEALYSRIAALLA